MSRLTRDGTAEPVSRDQILRHVRGQGNTHFPCSTDHEQDWQPYPVDPYSAKYVMTIHTVWNSKNRLSYVVSIYLTFSSLFFPFSQATCKNGWACILQINKPIGSTIPSNLIRSGPNTRKSQSTSQSVAHHHQQQKFDPRSQPTIPDGTFNML